MEATFKYPAFISYAVGSFSGGHRDAFFRWSHMQRLSLPDFDGKYLNGEYLRSTEEDKQLVLELVSDQDIVFRHLFDVEKLTRESVPPSACRYCLSLLNVEVCSLAGNGQPGEDKRFAFFRGPAQVGLIFQCPGCEWWRVIKHSNALHDEVARYVNFIYEGVIRAFPSENTRSCIDALERTNRTVSFAAWDGIQQVLARVIREECDCGVRCISGLGAAVKLMVAESSNPVAFLVETDSYGVSITEVRHFLGAIPSGDNRFGLWVSTGRSTSGTQRSRVLVKIDDPGQIFDFFPPFSSYRPWDQVFGVRPPYRPRTGQLWHTVREWFS
jgi:hypothetical protein